MYADLIYPLFFRFLKTKPLASSLIEAIKKEGPNFKIYPESSYPVLISWLEKIDDWCLSRQLWWGHKIPLFTPDSSFLPPIAANSLAEAKMAYINKNETLNEEVDVLDTWFSSCLLPLSAISNDYQISVLETGSDILFFWVARMLLLCTHLSGKLPFKRILLHGMVIY